MVTGNDRHDREFDIARKRMLNEQIVARQITDRRVIDAMGRVPRHLFVDEALKSRAYTDAPLNIGEGQTISQPYIVALMTEALALTGSEKILEIGTGCGYQTTILSLLARQVYTIERIKSLAMRARARFKNMGLKNVVMRIGDGSMGWPEGAPFDRILVACAAPLVPEALLSQLSHGGYVIVPVEAKAGGGDQDLLKVSRLANSEYKTENLGPCRFVKLIGKYGY